MRPVTVHEVEAVVHSNPPGFEVTVYFEIAAPPVFAGALQETTDSPLAFDVPDTDVGTPGTLDGMTAADAEEAEPVPDTFVAVTENEYEVPLVRPETVHDVVAVAHVNEPGVDVTV